MLYLRHYVFVMVYYENVRKFLDTFCINHCLDGSPASTHSDLVTVSGFIESSQLIQDNEFSGPCTFSNIL